jgi:hypothetical protein
MNEIASASQRDGAGGRLRPIDGCVATAECARREEGELDASVDARKHTELRLAVARVAGEPFVWVSGCGWVGNGCLNDSTLLSTMDSRSDSPYLRFAQRPR